MNNKHKTLSAAIFTGLVLLWFTGIAILFLFQKVILVPGLKELEYSIQELELKEASLGGGEVYLLGLGMKFPPEGLTPRSAVPFFTSHRVEMVSVFLSQGDVHDCNVIISTYPDDPQGYGLLALPPGRAIGAVLFPSASAYELLDRMHRAKATDFSWWNCIYDTRLVYLLYLKGIITPGWHHNGRIYHVKTRHYSGYIAEGRYGKTRAITELMFADNGILYQVTILTRSSQDFKGLLSTVRAVGMPDADEIIRRYSDQAYSRDLVLASRVTRHVTISDLEELIGLIENRKAAGQETVTNVGPLKAELEYLKSTSQ